MSSFYKVLCQSWFQPETKQGFEVMLNHLVAIIRLCNYLSLFFHLTNHMKPDTNLYSQIK